MTRVQPPLVPRQVSHVYVPYPFPWQSVVEITTTVTDRYDELDEVVCDLLSSLNKL